MSDASAPVIGVPATRPVQLWRLGMRPGFQLSLLLAALVLGSSLRQPGFLTSANITGLLQSMLAPLVLALAASVALFAGIADLGIGSVTGACAMSLAACMATGVPAFAAVLVALAVGLLAGLLNATAVVGLGANSIVATIGSLAAWRGVVLLMGGDQSKVAVVPALESIVGLQVGAIPVLFIIVVAAYIAVSAWLAFARAGRHIQAVGGNLEAAARAGIATGHIRGAVLLATGFAAALAALIYVGQLDAAPVTLGTGLELQVYAGILISGFSLTGGGSGSPMTAIAGMGMLAVLLDLLSLANVSPGWQNILTGALVAVAVGIDVVRRRDRFV